MNRLDIQNAFVKELLNTDENQTVIKIREYIYNTISTPKIQEQIKYKFETQQTPEQQEIIKLLMIVYFGFYPTYMSDEYCLIDMKNFLD